MKKEQFKNSLRQKKNKTKQLSLSRILLVLIKERASCISRAVKFLLSSTIKMSSSFGQFVLKCPTCFSKIKVVTAWNVLSLSGKYASANDKW